jgi:5-methylcytosine-specific restriction endonuclease McrA
MLKLTDIQKKVLSLLDDGNIMVIDKMNLATIKDKNVASSTRYFLTKNKLVERKDKTKSINTKGNGYVISEKGKEIFLINQKTKKRSSPRVLAKEKKCGKCNLVKHISEFVNIWGYKNPRGKYCYNCFLDIEQEHAISLMDGRDFCIYCGKKIEKVYDWEENGKSSKTYIHLDHMDPISLGGRDSDQNTVYCCVECNLKKGDKLFVDWLKTLKPEFQKLSRDVYISKHHRKPESFKPMKYEYVIAFK